MESIPTLFNGHTERAVFGVSTARAGSIARSQFGLLNVDAMQFAGAQPG